MNKYIKKIVYFKPIQRIYLIPEKSTFSNSPLSRDTTLRTFTQNEKKITDDSEKSYIIGSMHFIL